MIIAGVDEAGRGALIGNVVAAAVILPQNIRTLLSYPLKDSKKINEKTRNILRQEIKQYAVDYAIGQASPCEIDALNIHHATLLAMKRAIESLKTPIDCVWVDGKFCPKLNVNCESFVGGDDLHYQISAASILAKTERDNQLKQLDKKYPCFGLASHKGYPTKAHKQAIETYGLLAEHRKSYKTIKDYLEK